MAPKEWFLKNAFSIEIAYTRLLPQQLG